jgi:DUF4097 and DUF4098 domain-containing protein YvlB
LALSTAARADTRLVRTLPLEPGGRFILSSKGGSVTVTGSPRSNAVVVITSKRDDLEARMEFQFEEDDGVVRVTACESDGKKSFWGAMFNWGADSIEFEYDIRVPTATQLEIDTSRGAVRMFEIRGTVRLETGAGSIGVRDLKGALTAETASGDITLERIDGDARVAAGGGKIRASDVAGDLFGRTNGGPIELENVAGDIDVGTAGAPVKIDGAGARVSARTSGGPMSVRFAAGNDSGGKLKSYRGGITVALDSGINLVVDAHALGGRVRTDLPIRLSGDATASRLLGALGSGGERLILRCTGGSIVLNPI